ncbi:MAG: DUF5667 domain-containing protein [Patescibacteria group bacterium]|nr:DUF5667 domain-containing protein [Patescibacteria group bacterium]
MSNKRFTDVELIKRLERAGQVFRLDESDKGAIKAELMTVIKSTPTRTYHQGRVNIFNHRRLTMPIIPMILALVIALGGSTAALADAAKPGDMLYPIDQLVEQLQEKLTFSEQAKAGLFALFSEERADELGALLALDADQLSEKMRENWEAHKEHAIERLAISIEKAEAIRDYFEAKLSETTDEATLKVYQMVIDRMDEIITRRELKVDDIDKHFPPTPPAQSQEVRNQIRTFMTNNVELFQQVQQEVESQFGVTVPAIAPNPYPIKPEFDEQIPDAWRQLEQEMARQREEIAKQIRAKFENGEVEWKQEEKYPTPQPMTTTVTAPTN